MGKGERTAFREARAGHRKRGRAFRSRAAALQAHQDICPSLPALLRSATACLRASSSAIRRARTPYLHHL